jgi:hypothetical protein
LLQLCVYPSAIAVAKTLRTVEYVSEALARMQMPKQHALVRRLDALYAERDDALDEGDLDRVHQLQAAITETAQQVLAANLHPTSGETF